MATGTHSDRVVISDALARVRDAFVGDDFRIILTPSGPMPPVAMNAAALETVLRLGSKLGSAHGVSIGIEAPIIRMSKAEIVAQGVALGAPLQLTWSCYAGGAVPCGTCDSCLLRAAGFAEAGVTDPALAG